MLAGALQACDSGAAAPTRENFQHAIESFLAERGDLCLAMFDWPIDLTPAEAGARGRHALQLPVLEKLGLARSTVVEVARTDADPQGVVKRYELTDAGRRFYKPHAHTASGGVAHANDFCAAHLSLDRVVDWQIGPDRSHPQALVSYTYHVEPAPWMKDADAQRVFPMVMRVIDGADGQLQLKQALVAGERGWVARPGL